MIIKQHVFIVGSKEIPSAYGGYETFLDKLTEYHQHEEGILVQLKQSTMM